MSIHDDCTGCDLAAGVATGLRSFDVDELGRLRGVHYARIWRPGENVARCNAIDFNGNANTGLGTETPAGRCDNESHGCGFWAYHDGSEYHAGKVHGVIEGYGKTTVGTKGFRAEKARIVALTIPRKPEPPSRSRWDRFCLWADRYTGFSIPVSVGLIFGGSTGGTVSATEATGWLRIGLVALGVAALIAGGVLGRASFRGLDVRLRPLDRHLSATERDVSPALAAKLRRNYPDVKFYDSVAAMKKAHPVDKALEPTPDNDPNFWADVEPESQPLAPPTVQWQFNDTGPYVEHMRALQQSINRMKGGTR